MGYSGYHCLAPLDEVYNEVYSGHHCLAPLDDEVEWSPLLSSPG